MQLIDINISQSIATLRLNSPQNLNALNEPMLAALEEAVDQCQFNPLVKVIVISGSGKGFSGGGDIGAMLQGIESGDLALDASMEKLAAAALKIREVKKPVIASIHGPTAGAGFNLALLCDFRICAESTKFIQAFVNIGLVPDMGGIFSLSKLIGSAKTTELVMLGRPLNANEAYALGLVNQVVPDESLASATLDFALGLCSKPAVALAHMKTLINNSVYEGLETALKHEANAQIECAKTEDFVEGITAFAQKRKAEFKGK